MGRWLYLSVVRPAVTYGALVWSRVCRFEGVMKQLERLNRLALLTLGHFRRSTPTAGLEVLTYIPPLDISIKGEAAMGAYRTRKHQLWPINETSGTVKSKQGHRKTCQTYLDAFEVGDIGEDDKIDQVQFWDNQFQVISSSFERGIPFELAKYNIYTDGSRLDEKAGSGIVVYKEGKMVYTKPQFILVPRLQYIKQNYTLLSMPLFG